MSNAPREIALHWRPGLAVTNGPLRDHPEYTRYIRADTALSIKDVYQLAQIIREVDGDNTLGAGALAKAILAKLEGSRDE